MRSKLLSVLLMFCLVGCSQGNLVKNPEPIQKEVGLIPTEVTWEQRTYQVTTEFVDKVGERLGTAQVSLNQMREVYKIPGKDPKTELAVALSGNNYVRAVAKE